MNDSPNDVLACLVGQCCWYCSVGSGLGGLTLKLGKRIEVEWTRSKGAVSEYMLWVQASAWRVESEGRVLSTDSDPQEEASWTNLLLGKKIVSVRALAPAWDLIVEFEEHLRLRVFCNPPDTGDMDDSTAWSFSSFGRGGLCVGPRGKWTTDDFADWSEVREPEQV